MSRCLADVEAGAAAEVDKGGEASSSLPKPRAELTITGQIWKFMTAGVIGQSCSFPGACASPAVSRRRFSKEFSCYRNRKM